MGPPGAGKGSLASLCEQRLSLPHVSTGEIFRQEIARNSPLGRRVRRYVTSGRLVPNALVVQVMAKRLASAELATGYVLDGFPRTAGQAAGLDRVLQRRGTCLDGAVYLATPVSVLIRRLSGRRVCGRCGVNYHIRTMRPKRPGRCDRCGRRLMIRKDDQPEMILRRLAVDRTTATPLLRYYRRRGLLYRVNGAGALEAAFQRMARLFRRQGWMGNDRTQNTR